MEWSSVSVSGWDVRDEGGVGKLVDGSGMLRRAWRSGMEEMVLGVKDVQGLIWRMSHQKCLALLSRTWMFSWRTRDGAGFAPVR